MGALEGKSVCVSSVTAEPRHDKNSHIEQPAVLLMVYPLTVVPAPEVSLLNVSADPRPEAQQCQHEAGGKWPQTPRDQLLFFC